MFRKFILTFSILFASLAIYAAGYSYMDCEGSLTPYPVADRTAEYPDSLTPVFINHVGRHGSRYPASDTHCLALRKALRLASKFGTLTPLGERLSDLNEEIIRRSDNQWGALDSLGQAEQFGIGLRLCRNYPEVFRNKSEVTAISSHSPRSIASMEACIDGLMSCNSSLRCHSSSGKSFDPVVRPFDFFKSYADFRKEKLWEPPYSAYFNATVPTSSIRRVLGENYPFKDDAEARELALTEYYVLAGCSAMSMTNPMADFFTPDEANALWSCFNLRQYLQRSASAISSIPADIAAPLLEDLISTTDSFITKSSEYQGKAPHPSAILRFGHGETILPLVSLMKLPDCYYITDYYPSVAKHWHDFHIIPMAANVQFILFRSEKSGCHYCQILLNETPVKLQREDSTSIYPWDELRRHLIICLP